MTEPNPKVHRYRMSREEAQRQIILAMWLELHKPPDEQDPDTLYNGIRNAGHAWAIPTMADIDDDELLTTAQLSDLLGYRQSTIRDWPTRYGIQRIDNHYRWADVRQMLNNRTEGAKTRV